MDQQNKNQTFQDEESIDLKETLFKYLRYWPYFLISIVIAILVAFVYLKYADTIYNSTGKIKILKDNQGLDFSSLQGSSPLLDLSEVNLENEKEIIRSRKLLSNVIEKLNLQTKVEKQGQLTSQVIYKDEIPVIIKWHHSDDELSEDSPVVLLNLVDESNYKIIVDELGVEDTYKYGETVKIDNYSFSIQLKDDISQDVFENEYSFKYLILDKLISNLSQAIQIQPVGERSEILQLSLSGQNENRNEAIINNLIDEFMQDGVRDNRKIAKRTKDFVEDRLKYLVDELDSVEQSLVEYKQLNDIINIQVNAEQLFEKSTKTELEYFNKSKQLSIAKLFKNELKSTSTYQLLPVNIGIESENVNALTDKYNEKLLERQKLLVSSTTKNPQIREINLQVQDLKSNIISSVDNYILSLKQGLQEIDDQINKFDRKISSLPRQEKNIRKIGREQAVKEKLYLFLLQKQLEAGLSYAVAAPKAKVVDYAYTNPQPESPKKLIILAASLILGLAIPFSFIYLKFLLYTKIYSKTQVERAISNALVVAEIPHVKSKEHKQISKYDDSPIAEAFRILRTNIGFIKPVKKEKDQGRLIFITSSTKGEGKTFISANLSSVYAANNKKTLLIGTDLRNPQLHTIFNLNRNDNGLTNYLSDESIRFNEIIKPNVDNNGVDVILSGPIPPNPSELLDSKRFSTLIKEAKQQYDFIIVDTAPTIHVSDTLLISHLSDVFLYIIRANYTDYKLTDHINKFKKLNNLDNIGFVVNGLSSKGDYPYNYGYGYGYGEKKKTPFYQFWKS